MLDTMVRGGLVVTPTAVQELDVGIADGVFAALGLPGELTGREVIDATDRIILPGGVDPHVHIATRFGDAMTRDDFATATIPAAYGGTTTLVEFAIPREGETTADAVVRRHREAAGRAVVDYAFHAVVTGSQFDASLDQLGRLRAEGVGTVKVFSAYLDTVGISIGRIHSLFRAARRAGMLVLVHCETESLVQQGIADVVAAGDVSPRAHARARSALAEVDAIRTVCDLAADTGCPVYIVHISTAGGIQEVARRKATGQLVYAETCTHYLFLNESVYARADAERWICSPPIRSASDSAGLWRAIDGDGFDAIATDHNCFDSEQKAAGRADFRTIPNGLPGIEYRMPLLVDTALTGRLNWLKVVRLASELPSRAMGLWPRKGAISVGSDADFLIVDPIGSTDLEGGHMATDYSPFTGLSATGSIRQTWQRGNCLVRDGELLAHPGSGRYLRSIVSL